jgi:hypothetical protein
MAMTDAALGLLSLAGALPDGSRCPVFRAAYLAGSPSRALPRLQTGLHRTRPGLERRPRGALAPLYLLVGITMALFVVFHLLQLLGVTLLLLGLRLQLARSDLGT